MNKNRNTRMDKLNNAGIDTGRFFNINLPDGLAPGATISVVINEDGQPVVVNNAAPQSYDAVATQIIEDGYVRNTKLYRRFVTAQMWRMLNHKYGYHGALEGMPYEYTLSMMTEEIRVLGKLEERDKECFEERAHFFNKGVVMSVLWDYMEKLEAYVLTLPEKNCKGVPYITIKGKHYFVADVEKKVYNPICDKIQKVFLAETYTEMYRALSVFMKTKVKLPYDTAKSKAWIDAYKGNGAYYTCKNLIMFHGCRVYCRNFETFRTTEEPMNRDRSLGVLADKLEDYAGEGWRMMAFMKKLIEDNNFDFDKKMREIYN